MAADGELAFGGRLPVNTHGGLLAYGFCLGISHLTEAVAQLRGTRGVGQVPDAQVALVAGLGVPPACDHDPDEGSLTWNSPSSCHATGPRQAMTKTPSGQASRPGTCPLPECVDCNATRWYLFPTCLVCGSLQQPRWKQLTGAAELFTWTRVERPFVSASGPFTVGLLVCDGAEDVRVVAPIAVPGLPRIGARLTVRFVTIDSHTIPVFTDETSWSWSS